MSTSNQLSVSFRHVRQISQLRPASETTTTRKAASELTTPGPSGVVPTVVAPRNAKTRRQNAVRRLGKGLAIVFTPVLLAAAYVYLLASPMYVSETHFAVRGGESMRVGGALGGLLSGGNPVAGLVDGYSVRDFLQSREAMEKLDKSAGFVSRIAKPDADYFVRLPANASRDRAYQAYKSFVQANFNMVEQIVVVRVFAFSPDDASTMAQALSTMAEKFSDEINKRAREDALALSESEMERADRRVRDARLQINEWRNRNANIDPTANVLMINTLIASLETTLADTRSQLAILNIAAQDNPNRRNLEQRIGVIREQIAEAKRRLTGSESRSEAVQLGEYERLKIDLESAEKTREGTRSSLDEARVSLLRQQKYVFTVAAPSHPDTPDYPGPYRFMGGGLILGLVLLAGISLGTGMLRDSFS